MCHYAPYNGNEVYVLVTFIWNTDIERSERLGIVGVTHSNETGTRCTCPMIGIDIILCRYLSPHE